VKTAVSIPDSIFDAAEETARRLGMSRSQLYAKAVQRFVELHRYGKVTEALDRVYADEPSELDPVLASLQAASIEDEGW
jgi:metal-responsive CopG/Arc/MetJ family transcriptional regulator